MKTKPPFDLDDDISTKLKVLEQVDKYYIDKIVKSVSRIPRFGLSDFS